MAFILKLICMAMSANWGVSARASDTGFYASNISNYPYIGPGERKMPRPEMASPFSRQIETPNKPQPQNPMQFPFASPGPAQEKKQQSTPFPAIGGTDGFQGSSVDTDTSKAVMNPQKKPEVDEKFHNAGFKNTVGSNQQIFLEFMRRNPDVREGFNEVIANYGIMDPEVTENTGMNSPDPDYLIKTIDQSLSLHAAFKKFVREELFNINGHILANNDKIRISVRRMKLGLGELNGLKRSIGKTKSKSRKSKFLRDYANILINLDKPKSEFLRRVAWLKKVQEGLEEKL